MELAKLPIVLEDLDANALQLQVNKIQNAMAQVMQDKVHFGLVPGCGDKPALLKAGAEKLAMMFRLIPEFKINRIDLADGHREYEIVCTLRHQSGWAAGQGVGTCSTMESKYRYRGAELTLTDVAVPSAYWGQRGSKERYPDELVKALGGEYEPKQLAVQKTENGWFIGIKGEKKANPDIADTYNTVLKMGKKRALVDAVITATAASDIFTQDIDETIESFPQQEAQKGPYLYKIPYKTLSEDQWEWLETNGAKQCENPDYWISQKALPRKVEGYLVPLSEMGNAKSKAAPKKSALDSLDTLDDLPDIQARS